MDQSQLNHKHSLSNNSPLPLDTVIMHNSGESTVLRSKERDGAEANQLDKGLYL